MRPLHAVASLSVLALAVLGHASPAEACHNEEERVLDPRIENAAVAERAIEAGKLLAGAERELRDFPRLVETDELRAGSRPGTDRLGARAQRIVALALVRSEGLLPLGGRFAGTTAASRRRNLEWSAATLRSAVASKGTPAAETDLAEALAKLPETRAEARTLLERLDQRDLVTSPRAYAVLAQLRGEAGDGAGRDAAQGRYLAMKRRSGAPR